MVDVNHQLEIVREMGNIVVELLEVGFAPASYGCPENDDGDPLLEEDDRFWDNLLELQQVLQQFGDVEIGNEYREHTPSRTLNLERVTDTEDTARVHVHYWAKGGAYIGGDINTSEGNSIDIFDQTHDRLSPAAVGRLVARAELMILILALGSSAETLDYWMVEMALYRGSDYEQSEMTGIKKVTQSKWADIRGVSRQAVSKQITSAKRKLDATQN